MLPQSLWVLGATLAIVAALSWFFGRTLARQGHARHVAQPARGAAGGHQRRAACCSPASASPPALGAVAGVLIAPITFTSYDAGVDARPEGLRRGHPRRPRQLPRRHRRRARARPARSARRGLRLLGLQGRDRLRRDPRRALLPSRWPLRSPSAASASSRARRLHAARAAHAAWRCSPRLLALPLFAPNAYAYDIAILRRHQRHRLRRTEPAHRLRRARSASAMPASSASAPTARPCSPPATAGRRCSRWRPRRRRRRCSPSLVGRPILRLQGPLPRDGHARPRHHRLDRARHRGPRHRRPRRHGGAAADAVRLRAAAASGPGTGSSPACSSARVWLALEPHRLAAPAARCGRCTARRSPRGVAGIDTARHKLHAFVALGGVRRLRRRRSPRTTPASSRRPRRRSCTRSSS